jgi:hypothetical protein
MKRTLSFIVVAVLAAAVLSGCGGGGDSKQTTNTTDPNPVLGALISSPSPTPVTSFGQSIVSHDTGTDNGSYDIFPGQPNVWDIGRDFSLEDGNDDQFDGALKVMFGSAAFPENQDYSELSFYTPIMGSADGIKVAVVSDGLSMGISSALTGSYSAFLNATSFSRLQQAVDLSGATGQVLLRWNHNASMYGGNMPGFTPNYRVVVRDFLTGDELEELSATTVNELYSAAPFLTAYAGQKIILSFEMSNMPEDWQVRGAIIDDVSVKDNNGAGTERVVNGDFETGDLTGWSVNSPVEVQNMTSGPRNYGCNYAIDPTCSTQLPLDGLTVTRSFYTVPNKLWGRWVDVFENPDLVSSVTTTVTYRTNLGSDYCGVIYDTPGTSGKAITSWDSTWDDRDIGLVFGSASSKTYTSTTVLDPLWTNDNCDGDDNIAVEYGITVPAGGKAAIVNFIILGSHDTGLTAPNISARAVEVDDEAARIVNNFWTDGQYRTGMTQEQIDAIKNF